MSKPNSPGISLEEFSSQTGIRKALLLHYCRKGRIEGALFDRISWQWRIHAPVRFITGKQS